MTRTKRLDLSYSLKDLIGDASLLKKSAKIESSQPCSNNQDFGWLVFLQRGQVAAFETCCWTRRLSVVAHCVNDLLKESDARLIGMV